jgi:hypothetical protein
MDDSRFDNLSRTFGRCSRRGFLTAAGAAALAALLGRNGQDVALAKKKKRKRKSKKRMMRPAPLGCIPNCAGKACGGDGCGGSCGTCLSDSVCEDGRPCNVSCEGGQCLCLARSHECTPNLCCREGAACVHGACGACPAGSDPCAASSSFVCGNGPPNCEAPCRCVTSVEPGARTTCSSLTGLCHNCNSDEDCTNALVGTQGVCIDVSGCPNGETCSETEGRKCVVEGCIELNCPATQAAAGDSLLDRESGPGRRG